MSHLWPWLTLALLGAYHGLNPAMGWLFALSIGLQERRRSAVIGALFPIALGHALAIMVAILLLRFAQHFIPISIQKPAVALVLFALGGYRILRASHPRRAGLRVGRKDLFLWSFLMASAHGAGLMLLPILMSQPMQAMPHPMAAHSLTGTMPVAPAFWNAPVAGLAVFVHTVSMLTVAGILALLFFESYEKMGLRLLRHAWVNFDLLWAIALLVAGLSVLFL
jgi:hypothetical protein